MHLQFQLFVILEFIVGVESRLENVETPLASELHTEYRKKLLTEGFLQFKLKYCADRTKNLFYVVLYTAGQAVVQLVEALLYKTEGRWFDS